MFSKIRPFIFKLDPELAHDLAIKALKTNSFKFLKFTEVILISVMILFNKFYIINYVRTRL